MSRIKGRLRNPTRTKLSLWSASTQRHVTSLSRSLPPTHRAVNRRKGAPRVMNNTQTEAEILRSYRQPPSNARSSLRARSQDGRLYRQPVPERQRRQHLLKRHEVPAASPHSKSGEIQISNCKLGSVCRTLWMEPNEGSGCGSCNQRKRAD
ncbi:hypothetical protein Mp_4g10110 [Marchantia polymorpha subsp. ruderalis]|uniref:Uncharacterized protein n=2 Tax=Marchantia polymorpha TaxID=3197 RepID=A0AAF6B8C0_MARPO|nr:hypothetical protein MARPO_0132s0054 [Marchantia polymorpha]BBN08254.1 hypothetical protein Mp_4g10110 [Marchantia polymorpha subsp. ruderalis]|eukprot:PTQ29984.1 hypothetical protein MARPO_0132s0054 [Marchantia polymorpha]